MLTLDAAGGKVVSLGDGTSQITTAAQQGAADTILAGSGAGTLDGVIGGGAPVPEPAGLGLSATVFGSSGSLNGASEQDDLVAGSGSVTVEAASLSSGSPGRAAPP